MFMCVCVYVCLFVYLLVHSGLFCLRLFCLPNNFICMFMTFIQNPISIWNLNLQVLFMFVLFSFIHVSFFSFIFVLTFFSNLSKASEIGAVFKTDKDFIGAFATQILTILSNISGRFARVSERNESCLFFVYSCLFCFVCFCLFAFCLLFVFVWYFLIFFYSWSSVSLGSVNCECTSCSNILLLRNRKKQ